MHDCVCMTGPGMEHGKKYIYSILLCVMLVHIMLACTNLKTAHIIILPLCLNRRHSTEWIHVIFNKDKTGCLQTSFHGINEKEK